MCLSENILKSLNYNKQSGTYNVSLQQKGSSSNEKNGIVGLMKNYKFEQLAES